MTTIQNFLIKLKTRFITAHRDLKGTNELTIEDVGYNQDNLVNNIILHTSSLLFPYPSQDPVYNTVPNLVPTIVLTLQPTQVANVSTYAVSNILPHLLTSMQHIQKLLIQMHTNQIGGGRENKPQ